MVMYRRIRKAGGTYFFTLNLEDRRSSLLVDHIGALRAAFRQTRNQRPFVIEAIVILPNHLHAVITLPESDDDYAGRWRAIKSQFTRRLAAAGIVGCRRSGRGYELWQRRYWEHCIRDDRDLKAHIDYIHFNPVKHAWVEAVVDWPYSSFHRYVRDGILPADWGSGVKIVEGSFGE